MFQSLTFATGTNDIRELWYIPIRQEKISPFFSSGVDPINRTPVLLARWRRVVLPNAFWINELQENHGPNNEDNGIAERISFLESKCQADLPYT